MSVAESERGNRIPVKVADEESVARLVFTPSFFVDGRLGPTAFALSNNLKSGPENDISLLRMWYCDVTSKDVYDRIHPRTPGDTLSGYARLQVSGIRTIGSPNETDRINVDVLGIGGQSFHAGIQMRINEQLVTSEYDHRAPLLLYILKRLVNLSEYIELQGNSVEASSAHPLPIKQLQE